MGDQKKQDGAELDHAALIGPIHPVGQIGHYEGEIWLAVNGERGERRRCRT